MEIKCAGPGGLALAVIDQAKTEAKAGDLGAAIFLAGEVKEFWGPLVAPGYDFSGIESWAVHQVAKRARGINERIPRFD